MRPQGPMETGQSEIGRARRSLHRLESAREIGCRRAWALVKPRPLVKRGLGALRNPRSLTLTNQASVNRSLVERVLAKRVLAKRVSAKQGLRVLAKPGLWALAKPGPGASRTVPVRRKVASRR